MTSKELRDESQAELFMNQFGGPKADLDNDIGLVNVPLYIGGLAEKQTDTPNGEGRESSLMGEVFTFLITTALMSSRIQMRSTTKSVFLAPISLSS